MPRQQAKRLCVYCGQPVGRVKKGEHIVPAAIGGRPTIKCVCGTCNNEFSVIDTELCSRSPLSAVASEVMDAQIWQVWDVDRGSRNLLLEARPDWSAGSLKLYPQIVFERRGPEIRGDYEEMQQFGRESFERVLIRGMLRAFRRHHAENRPSLHFERIRTNQMLSQDYRFPARVFARMSIGELAQRLERDRPAPFVVRYLTEADRRFALNTIDNWDSMCSFPQTSTTIGSHLPPIRFYYDGVKVLRALAKTSINALSAFCPHTPVRRGAAGFDRIIRIVTGETAMTDEFFASNGFVRAVDIQPIKLETGHSFRLLHMDHHWHVFSSFFDGRIGAFLRFRAPNGETWHQADIEAPIKSSDWKVTTGRILQPLTVRVEWQDFAKIVPSMKMLNVKRET